MTYDDIRKAVLEVEEIKLIAQLRAVRGALKGAEKPTIDGVPKRKSQTEYVYILLKQELRPLHVTEIISLSKEKFGIELNRESIASAILKKVYRLDRFIRTAPNTFGLNEHRDLYQEDIKKG